MKKRTVMISLVAAMMFLATTVFAQGGMMGKMRGGMGPMMMGLELTDDQEAKLAEMRVKNQIEMVDLKAQIKKLNLKIKQELMKDNPSKKEILALVDKINSIKARMAEKRVEHLFAMKGILTPEQWHKVALRFPAFHRGGMGRKCAGGCRGMRGKEAMGGCREMKKAPCPRSGGRGGMMKGM